MKAFIHYISLPFIYLTSILPFWLMQLFSNFLFLILYKVIGYRKKVVLTNLKNSFPEKSDTEIKQLMVRHYRYFFDLVLETIKTLSISRRTLKKRVTFNDTSIFKKYYKEKRSVIVVMGHYGNWELGGARFALEAFHKLNIVYHPLHNEHFNRLMYKMRTRLGNGLYSMKNTLRCIIKDSKKITATAFIADQTPPPSGAYWMNFLNQDTPVFNGTGKIAHKFNYPVIYASVKRVKRGYYNITFEELFSNPNQHEPDEINNTFMTKLEEDIKEMPEIWLWTHRRWKHKRKQ